MLAARSLYTHRARHMGQVTCELLLADIQRSRHQGCVRCPQVWHAGYGAAASPWQMVHVSPRAHAAPLPA